MKVLLTDDGQYKEIHLTLWISEDGYTLLEDSTGKPITSTSLSSVQDNDCDKFLGDIREAIDRRIGLL